MKSVIVGTAGHIDHGKTALVKALTGIDADRLEEEKRRGITIDLGFAHLELPGADAPLLLGFVDVPGHERFVRNMLAGVGGIDLVLFVIAADESIKPQTREHFDICRLLEIPRGITVLTKSDLVDKETLAVVRLEVEEFLRGSFLDAARAPLVAVSAKTGEGMERLRLELGRAAAEASTRDAGALFRLPIDRVFTMKGFGTVVTGTLVAGSVAIEDEVEVLPAGRRARVRGVQVHGAAAERAVAGQRTALNLAGVAKQELARGMTLARPGALRATRRLEASLTLLAGAPALADRARVHFHAFTAETIAEVVLYSGKELRPGSQAFAQLRLADELLLLPGDRFILRRFSPAETIGGGVALEIAPATRSRKEHAAAVEYLETLAKAPADEALYARVARRGVRGLSLVDAVAATGWRPDEVEEKAGALAKAKRVARLENVFLSASALAAAQSTVRAAVDAFHESNPLVAGMGKEELRERTGLDAAVFAGALESLAGDKTLEVAGEQVRGAGRGVAMKGEEADAKESIEQAFARAGLRVPALKDVLWSLPLDRARAQKIVTLLLREKVLVKLSDELVFHRDALEGLRRSVGEYKKQSPKIDVARFKELAGVTRKYAIPLLEYLDRERVTRRVGDERVIL